jgi:hypothetical protein
VKGKRENDGRGKRDDGRKGERQLEFGFRNAEFGIRKERREKIKPQTHTDAHGQENGKLIKQRGGQEGEEAWKMGGKEAWKR